MVQGAGPLRADAGEAGGAQHGAMGRWGPPRAGGFLVFRILESEGATKGASLQIAPEATACSLLATLF